ncbi:Clp protease proteolytic subunit /Translocation-enhancing protein TepA [Ostreococcus tauri]|uniref:ATP-dependent Clp protease proteolytic subunit n=1 Tax=Ostreococcus tauri TaxID=70448 RepID=Q01ET1_OSTTA|nr:Clp protease proteolytic subunit /Translocation-enhancing protein TepA [Ostreococcus tauri]CAL52171.2 Clp protease proteolytic subunit /Translocation-enhancing protein TepA [Ostreococcus tauri]|eukprot:XP_003074903.1 Clp protease proteolytic subunit /Translocation-enhancing protein TepA [Ostreococcus tauri]
MPSLFLLPHLLQHSRIYSSRQALNRRLSATSHTQVWRVSSGRRTTGSHILPERQRKRLCASPIASTSPASANPGTSYNEHKPKTPPPDLPSLLLDSRIVYIGMPLVPAVTELIVSELLYLQYADQKKPCYIYINSTGCTRADGEVVGFETEATAIYDTMKYIGNEIYTVGTGVAVGQACVLLSAGDKGKRFMTPHATAMLHQPRVPSTGERQATELNIKWHETLAQKKTLLNVLSKTTGHSVEKLDKDMRRPLYMTAADAIQYGVADKIVTRDSKAIADVLSASAWDSAAGLVQKSI